MTPEAALYDFLSGFGVPVYAETAVPDDATEPYLTYGLVGGDWDDGEIRMAANAWFRTTSEAIPNAFVRELSRRIGLGGITVRCDGGMLWIKRGMPWSQSVIVFDDTNIKRRYLNIIVEYLVTD
jgi:hypothetical protein